MPNWRDPLEIQADSVVFIKVQHVMLGLYIWEWFLSLRFDWEFISGRKKFRWPMIFYFMGRYLLLFALFGIALALDTRTPINCQALYTFNQLAGDAAVGLASINLSLRTIAVWRQNKIIIAILVLIILGHWSLILQGVLLTAHWDDTLRTCVIDSTNNKILAATFIYSMAFDFIVLVLSAYRLLTFSTILDPPGTGTSLERLKTSFTITSRLGRMIFKDGLIYFFIAFVANLLATTFMVLNWNPIMSVIFNVPAAVASTIVACRVVRRLSNFADNDAEIYNNELNGASNIRFSATRGLTGVTTGAIGATSVKAKRHSKIGGVHVHMDTFSKIDEEEVEFDVEEESNGERKSGEESEGRGERGRQQRVVILPVVTKGQGGGDVDIEKGGFGNCQV